MKSTAYRRSWLKLIFGLLCLCLPYLLSAAPLRIVAIDVEGGQATLIVTPDGSSLLVDTGWPGFNGRDAQRIKQAADELGVKQIDYLIVTHYHRDHVGGVRQLAELLPIQTFIDHGPNLEDSENARKLYEEYVEVRKGGRHQIVKPGDRLKLGEVELIFVASAGELITHPLPGAGQPNPFCQQADPGQPDPSENARSVGFVLQYGKFRFLDLGDLTHAKELELVCPSNLIGVVDLYLTTHHGLHTSGHKALVHAVKPKVAIMNNGPRKGGSPEAVSILKSSPQLEDLWQLHRSLLGDGSHNSSEQYIANLEETNGGYSISVEAYPDGSFVVRNHRNNYTKRYAP